MSKIIDILTGLRPEEDFANSKDFILDGLLDSFDIINLVTELDAHYGISIDGMDIIPENFISEASIRALLIKNGATL
jgi:acyl carrier protein